MRMITIRAAAMLVLLAVTLVIGSVGALAQDEAAAICPVGHVGLSLHWADAQDSLFCAVTAGLTTMPAEIVGLVVRGPDGAIVTVGVEPADTQAADSPTAASTVTSSSSARSTSTSSSTTCINGRCTTSRNQIVCVDGSCSSHP
jgi:hypothetical protein